jgi:anti-sigma factor (TIGR02949 family)
MTHLLTCKQFLQELNDFLDESLDPELRREIERHVTECPNCFVLCDTTKRTLRVFKGMEAHPVPAEVQQRLLQALQKKIAQSKGIAPSARSDC